MKKTTKQVRLLVEEETTQTRQRSVDVIVPKSATKKQIRMLAVELCETGEVYFDRHDDLSDETKYVLREAEMVEDDTTEAQEWRINKKGQWETVD